MLWWFWFISFGSVLGLIALAFLCLIVYAFQSGLSWSLALGFLVCAGMAFGPLGFMRATWRRRTRPIPADAAVLWD